MCDALRIMMSYNLNHYVALLGRYRGQTLGNIYTKHGSEGQ